MGVQLLLGDDESIVRGALTELVHHLVGDGDRVLMVDDLDGEEYEVRAVVDAAQTPPFLTEKRVVVARDIGRFTAEEVAPLVAYLGDQLETTELVLVGGGGRIPKALTDAVKAAAGTITDSNPPTRARDRQGWIEQHVAAEGLKLDNGAVNLLASWLGEDVGRLDGILQTLLATFGTTKRLTVADVSPFLGDAGSVPPWDFTDAIDRADTTKALTMLGRMLGAGERHPLQVMAVLHAHYARLARLDGADAGTEAEAAAALGIKPGFPARKALENYRRLGGGGVARAFELLAQADLDLRGAKDLPEEMVMEVLVARLSRLARRS